MEAFLLIALVLVAAFTGTMTESLHYASIRRREKKFLSIPVITAKTYPGDRKIARAALATGSVVISVDHFKRFLTGIRQIFGGEIRSYASLLDRGRREALIRMKEKYEGADMFINCRIETSTISSGKDEAIGCVEVVAYSTALKFEP